MSAQPLRFLLLVALALFALAVAQLSGQTPLQRGLDPEKSIAQYVHEAWQIKEGLPQNSVQSITQTPDGYVWFTTQEGLVRFDGLRFTTFNKTNSALPENYCNAIVTDYAGAVWTATQTQGVVRLQNGRFTPFSSQSGLSSSFMPENARGLAASRDGSLWIATLGGGVNRLKDGAVTVYSTEQGLKSDDVYTLFMSDDSTLWIATAKGLNVLHTRTGAVRDAPLPSRAGETRQYRRQRRASNYQRPARRALDWNNSRFARILRRTLENIHR